MMNYWWVTRPKRKLDSIPEVLATFADISLNQEWNGQRGTQMAYEEALEAAGLKRVGLRRDQSGSGGRTYGAWLVSLGLIFKQASSGNIKLTLAGEAIMSGDSPVEVLTNQVRTSVSLLFFAWPWCPGTSEVPHKAVQIPPAATNGFKDPIPYTVRNSPGCGC